MALNILKQCPLQGRLLYVSPIQEMVLCGGWSGAYRGQTAEKLRQYPVNRELWVEETNLVWWC